MLQDVASASCKQLACDRGMFSFVPKENQKGLGGCDSPQTPTNAFKLVAPFGCEFHIAEHFSTAEAMKPNNKLDGDSKGMYPFGGIPKGRALGEGGANEQSGQEADL